MKDPPKAFVWVDDKGVWVFWGVKVWGWVDWGTRGRVGGWADEPLASHGSRGRREDSHHRA